MKDKETDLKTEAVDQRACSVRCPACGVLLNPDVPGLIMELDLVNHQNSHLLNSYNRLSGRLDDEQAKKRKALRMFWELDKGYMELYTRHQQLRKMNHIMFWYCVSLFACFVFVVIMWVKS